MSSGNMASFPSDREIGALEKTFFFGFDTFCEDLFLGNLDFFLGFDTFCEDLILAN